MRRRRQVGSSGIDLPDDQHIREVEEEGYKYLGMLQLDMILNTKMKGRITSDYVRRVNKLCRSKLNGGICMISEWHQRIGCECTTCQCRYYGLNSGKASQHGQKN